MDWKESIYADDDVICGFSLPFHEGQSFIICVLLKIENELKFKFSLIYSSSSYSDKIDFINDQFSKLKFESRIFGGYYEGYKYLDFDGKFPDKTITDIKKEIEKVLS